MAAADGQPPIFRCNADIPVPAVPNYFLCAGFVLVAWVLSGDRQEKQVAQAVLLLFGSAFDYFLTEGPTQRFFSVIAFLLMASLLLIECRISMLLRAMHITAAFAFAYVLAHIPLCNEYHTVYISIAAATWAFTCVGPLMTSIHMNTTDANKTNELASRACRHTVFCNLAFVWFVFISHMSATNVFFGGWVADYVLLMCQNSVLGPLCMLLRIFVYSVAYLLSFCCRSLPWTQHLFWHFVCLAC